jgi:hypothetical protein
LKVGWAAFSATNAFKLPCKIECIINGWCEIVKLVFDLPWKIL